MTIHAYGSGHGDVMEHQPTATLTQAAPVQNTWYTILDTIANGRLIGVYFKVADTGEDLELRITIDGQTYVGVQAAVADTPYYINGIDYSSGALSVQSVLEVSQRKGAFLLEGRNIKVEVRKTSAAGAGTFSGRAEYAKR